MSAPSDGARADARKRLAADVVTSAEPIVAVLSKHQLQYGPKTGQICTCGHAPGRQGAGSLLTQQDVHRGHIATELAGVIADAKAEAQLQIMDAIEDAAHLARVNSGDMASAADHYADGLQDAVIIARRVTS